LDTFGVPGEVSSLEAEDALRAAMAGFPETPEVEGYAALRALVDAETSGEVLRWAERLTGPILSVLFFAGLAQTTACTCLCATDVALGEEVCSADVYMCETKALRVLVDAAR
jgi:hypothetical protein